MKSFNEMVVAFCISVLLTSCGGSSRSPELSARLESTPPARTEPIVASALTFPLKAAMEESYKFATYTNNAVYGMCSGNSTNSSQAPVQATFEGVTGFSVISSETVTFTDCTPPSISATGTSYFDGNFVPIGSSVNGGEYGVYLTPPVIPDSVKVGDAGTIGTKTAYSDSTKANVVGHDDQTYVIEPDTATTAMVDLITKSYDSSGVLLITTHNRFKILPAGYLIPYSVDIRSSALHLVLVANTSYNNQGVDSFSPVAVSSPSSVQVSVTFREPIDTASITNNTFSLVSSTGVAVAGAIQFSGRTATFIPVAPLADGNYTVTVSKDVKSIYGTPMTGDYSVPIVIDAVPPSVVSVSPADGTTAVPVYVPGYDFAFITPLSVTFSEPLWLTGAEFIVTEGGIPVAGRVAGGMTSGGAPTATFTPDVHWKPNTTYTARITMGISDSVGNHPASDYVWSFTTESFLFKEYVNFAAGSPGEAVAIGDVNNDGRSDVVMTTFFYFSPATDYKLFVFLQNASGGLDAPITYATNSNYNCSAATVAVGDINHDLKNDVVIGNSGCGIEVFTQNAGGTLDAGVVHASTDARKIKIADLNNDGLMDVVGVGLLSSTTSIWTQSLGGTLNAPITYNFGGADIDVGDVNKDGLLDVVAASGYGIGILMQAAGKGFDAPKYYSYSTSSVWTARGVAVGDINGDGRDDVVATYGGNVPDSTLGVWYQNTLGTLDGEVKLATNHSPTPVEIVDVTGDGRKDICVGHEWSTLGVHEQLTDGSLRTEYLYRSPSAGWNPHGLVIGDINGDGKPDVVYSGVAVMYHY